LQLSRDFEAARTREIAAEAAWEAIYRRCRPRRPIPSDALRHRGWGNFDAGASLPGTTGSVWITDEEVADIQAELPGPRYLAKCGPSAIAEKHAAEMQARADEIVAAHRAWEAERIVVEEAAGLPEAEAEWDAARDAVVEIATAIREAPATTLEGYAAKARALIAAALGDEDCRELVEELAAFAPPA